jgi:hypothetical protein
MSHDNHTTDNSFKELTPWQNPKSLLKLVEHWKDPFPSPVVSKEKLSDGRQIFVVRDDYMPFGTKARAGSAIMSCDKYSCYDTIVYVQPRAGWAGLSLAETCRLAGKRLILFCPASKDASEHQRAAKAAGAELRFVKIAAMPVLQKYARDFAVKRNYLFFPLGLAVPEAVAGIAKVAMDLKIKPKQVWYAMSTGVLSRGLQLAWPKAEHIGVAVARNIQPGERGNARIISHPMAFLQDAKVLPPFPSARNYDAKVYEYMEREAVNGALMWNVAGEVSPKPPAQNFNSQREWGDLSDLERK